MSTKLLRLSASVLIALAAVFFTVALVNAEDAQSQRREEAKKTILIPWSKTAKTAELKLSENGTKIVNLWLDLCRSRYAGRREPSRSFMGTPHDVWNCENGTIELSVNFVTLVIENVKLPVADVIAITKAVASDEFATKTATEGDDEEVVFLWGLMLTSRLKSELGVYMQTAEYKKFAETEGNDPVEVGVYEEVCESLSTRLKEEFLTKTNASTAKFPKPGTLEAQRSIWLSSIATLAGKIGGEILIDLYNKLVEVGETTDATLAILEIAKAGGEKADEFILKQLETAKGELLFRIISVLNGNCSRDIVKKLCNVLLSNPKVTSPEKSSIVRFLEKVAKASQENSALALDTLLAYFKECPEKLKYNVAFALIRSGSKDDGVISYLQKLLNDLKENKPKDGRIPYIKSLLEENGIPTVNPADTVDEGDNANGNNGGDTPRTASATTAPTKGKRVPPSPPAPSIRPTPKLPDLPNPLPTVKKVK